jgi:ketosteroid isomerase-like protein
MYRPYNAQADLRPFRDVESQLREQSQDFAMAFNTGNYDHAARMFAGDGVLMAPMHEAAYGQKSVERLLRELGESGYSDLRLETMRVDHSGDMAMELGKFSAILHRADGTLAQERGKYVKVWRRLGAWLIVADCWSGTSLASSERAA